MCPATARTTMWRDAVRSQCCVGPARGATRLPPQSSCRPGDGRARLLTEPCRQVDQRRLAVAEPAALLRRAGQLDRATSNMVCTAGGVPIPARAGAAPRCRRDRLPGRWRAGCSAPGARSGCRPQGGCRCRARRRSPRRRAPRPRATARSPAHSRPRWRRRHRAPRSCRSRSSRDRASRRHGPCGRDLAGLDAEQDRVVHDRRLARDDLGAGDEGVTREMGVDQEAAVVVLAGGRRRRRVRTARQGDLLETLAGSQGECARRGRERGPSVRRQLSSARRGCRLVPAGGSSGLIAPAGTR